MVKPLEIPWFLILISLSLIAGAQDSVVSPPPEVCPGDKMVNYGVDAISEEGASMFKWFIEGGTIVSQIDRPEKSMVTVNWDDYADHYTLKVMEISANARCVGDTSITDIGIKETPNVDLGGNVYRCEDDPPVRFDAGSLDEDIIDYYWQDGSRGRYYVAYEPGIYSVITVGNNGCQSIDSVNLTVYEPPEVDLGDNFIVGTEDTTLDAGTFGGTYEWSTGEITQRIDVDLESPDTIWVKVTDAYGCNDRDTVIAKKYTDRIKIPSVITPNGDGINDEWVLEDLEYYHQAVVTVYDRWGTVVFQSSGAGNYDPWEGTYEGERLPMDSYHYIIDLKDGLPKLTGNVTIIR